MKIGDKVMFSPNIDKLLVEKARWLPEDTFKFNDKHKKYYGKTLIIKNIVTLGSSIYYTFEETGYVHYNAWYFIKAPKQIEFDFT